MQAYTVYQITCDAKCADKEEERTGRAMAGRTKDRVVYKCGEGNVRLNNN